ncbi:MAG: heat-inducible transcription repressor HrcA [Legionellales bacterium]|nr:heat-inducible transcription repressor HrcA [Legionellales bacterium]
MNKVDISERAQHLLKILVKRYIQDGYPVGSKTLADDTNLSLSSATIRNIMADLEHCGYLTSPHTSAGRIPTPAAYRFFVDSILSVQSETTIPIETIQAQLGIQDEASTHRYLQSVSSLLSGITKLAGLVSIPRRDQLLLRHVEFLPLSDKRVLVILVLNEKEVQNRIIYTDRIYSKAELQEAANLINQQYQGQELTQIHQLMLQAIENDKQSMQNLLARVIEITDKAFEPNQPEEDFILSGQDNLVNLAEDNLDRLRNLFGAFSKKHDILHLIDKCLKADGLQIFIGDESGYQALGDCALITSTYQVEGKIAGVLGVIGPTRIAYERVIPIVDVTARLLSAALNKSAEN